MNQILKIKEEVYIPRYPKVRNMILDGAMASVSGSVTKTIWRDAEKDAIDLWMTMPAGELRPDTTPKGSKRLGQAIWGLITGVMP